MQKRYGKVVDCGGSHTAFFKQVRKERVSYWNERTKPLVRAGQVYSLGSNSGGGGGAHDQAAPSSRV